MGDFEIVGKILDKMENGIMMSYQGENNKEYLAEIEYSVENPEFQVDMEPLVVGDIVLIYGDNLRVAEPMRVGIEYYIRKSSIVGRGRKVKILKITPRNDTK